MRLRGMSGLNTRYGPVVRTSLNVEQRRLVADSIGVGIASGAYGVSFGAIAVTSGFSVLQTCVMSLMIFTGASQFALVGVIASGGAPVSASATALMLGTRNALYGLKLASMLGLSGARRIGAAQLVIDESTAMTLKAKDPKDARLGFFAAGWAVFVLWNLATLIGAVAGSEIGDTRKYGLDAAVPAAFLALLWPRLTTLRTRLTALGAAALALSLVPFTRPGIPIIAAAGVAVLAALSSPNDVEPAESDPDRDGDLAERGAS